MNASNSGSKGTAIVYFSCTGNTEHVAEKIAEATDGLLLRLVPVQPYTQADLDYNSRCRANDEQNGGTARPEIVDGAPNVSMYDTIYLGYPIWWGKAPRIIFTFLESVDLAGKTVVPFCTSGSSSISGSLAELRAAAPKADWVEGRRFSAAVPQQEIDAWVESIHS